METPLFWNTPYQTTKYFESAKAFGLSPDVYKGTNELPIYFYKKGGRMIAWEVSPERIPHSISLPGNWELYSLLQISDTNNFSWPPYEEPNYFTAFSTRKTLMTKLRNNFARNIKQAQSLGLRLEMPETTSQINQALKLFINHEGSRDGFSYVDFNAWVKVLLDNNAAYIHSLISPTYEPRYSVVATAVILRSSTQVNLRYYSAIRKPQGIGHLLHQSLIDMYLSTQEIDIVDQSGIAHPNETNRTLLGINRFKLQTNPLIAQFTPLPKQT